MAPATVAGMLYTVSLNGECLSETSSADDAYDTYTAAVALATVGDLITYADENGPIEATWHRGDLGIRRCDYTMPDHEQEWVAA